METGHPYGYLHFWAAGLLARRRFLGAASSPAGSISGSSPISPPIPPRCCWPAYWSAGRRPGAVIALAGTAAPIGWPRVTGCSGCRLAALVTRCGSALLFCRVGAPRAGRASWAAAPQYVPMFLFGFALAGARRLWLAVAQRCRKVGGGLSGGTGRRDHRDRSSLRLAGARAMPPHGWRSIAPHGHRHGLLESMIIALFHVADAGGTTTTSLAQAASPRRCSPSTSSIIPRSC